MRLKVGDTSTEIEVGQYREVNKGALKAFFTIIEYPHGRRTTDCRYFEKGDQRWFSFPNKEYKKPGADRPEYVPYVSYLDKAYFDQFKTAVLEALKHHQVNNGQENTYQRQESPLQDDASPLWY